MLLVRVWHQDDELRSRLMFVTDRSAAPGATSAVQGIDAICAEIRRWLLTV